MTYQSLDFVFPFIVLGYGAIMTFVLHIPKLVKMGEERLPQHLWVQLQSHRSLGLICLVVGSLWSLQNLWPF